MSNELTLKEAARAWANWKKAEEAMGKLLYSDSGTVINPQKPPEVGTAEWANSLPEGTRVRHKEAGWTSGRFTVKRDGVWSKWNDFSWTPDEGPETGWELYTEPPAKKWRRWTPEEVPVGAQIRAIGLRWRGLILSVCANGEIQCMTGFIPAEHALANHEHSIDNGKTWLPCGVEVKE